MTHMVNFHPSMVALIEVKNNLTVTREEGAEGVVGEEPSKNTWTKPKGVGLRMGGGNEWGGGWGIVG